MKRRYQRVRDRVPFLNLGAGTAQTYDSNGREFEECAADSKYVRELTEFAALTTVRDKLAVTMLGTLGLSAPRLPCPSIFARDRLHLQPQAPEFVALNYMRGGGHYAFGQQVDANKWQREFAAFYDRLRKETRCVLICHNKAELDAARTIASDAETFISDDYADYLRAFSRASLGIMNRVHGGFGLASFGRPAFIIGTDSRARMAEEIGVRHAFVANVTADDLWSEYVRLRDDRTYAGTMETTRATSRTRYVELLQKALRGRLPE
jgi:hypothetical protein